MPDVHDHVSYLLGQACRTLRAKRARRLQAVGLHCGQDRLLLHLQQEGGLAPSTLAAHLDVEPPTVTNEPLPERAGTASSGTSSPAGLADAEVAALRQVLLRFLSNLDAA